MKRYFCVLLFLLSAFIVEIGAKEDVVVTEGTVEIGPTGTRVG